ncbi:MAG: cyclopropane-fatty-acyl-phospholipid synthase family protein [Burkholderiaceae bacterium]
MLEKQLSRYLGQLRERHPIPLSIQLWDGSKVDLHEDPAVTVSLRDMAAARRLVNPSLDSLGTAFVEGEIDVEGSIRDVIDVASALAEDADERRGLGKLPDWLAKHTRSTDKKAIEYHYDVSNEFYARWLDPAMVYSCAYFPQGDESLAAAQQAKLEHVCRKLRLRPGMTLLDIGCGWGALAIYAARHHGARVLGVTLSQNQFELATERVREAGLQDLVEIRLTDYRDIPGSEVYDRISSIGMLEHVGLKNLPEYFGIVHRLLKPGGLTLQHGITSADADDRSVGRGAGDFIAKYVFPDGELPHVSRAIADLSRAGLEVTDAESLRRHYARTLGFWSDALEAQRTELVELAGERRLRIWRVYLAGCAHAFAHGWVNIYQLLAARPRSGPDGLEIDLPMSRADLYAD